jgi:hypothetical protein
MAAVANKDIGRWFEGSRQYGQHALGMALTCCASMLAVEAASEHSPTITA